ncbi:DUF7287 family protein [Halorientalis pallida]|uniref:DUF7287 family protein n=1 Tax=Halorientalis pallida TaxID=2479928 RepID=UPI003C6F856C
MGDSEVMEFETGQEPSGDEGLLSDDRGQTLQDFVLGVSIFLIVVVFVFGLFPNFLSPFTAGVDAAERAQADRLARNLIENHSVEAADNTLNGTQLADTMQKPESTFRERFALATTASINVTVREIDGRRIVRYDGTTLAMGSDRANETSGSVSRIVSIAGSEKCQPGCRLIVKVW